MAEAEMVSATDGPTFQFRYSDGSCRRRSFHLDGPIQIQQAKTVVETQEAVEEAASNLIILGCLTVIRTLKARDEVLASSLKFYLEGRLEVPLRQLQERLETLGVLKSLQDNMSLWNMFIGGPPAPLTAHQITDLFKVSFSERGSSHHLEEERAVGQWRDWLIDIEGGDAVLTLEEEEVRVTFDDLLMFATGTNRTPPLMIASAAT